MKARKVLLTIVSVAVLLLFVVSFVYCIRNTGGATDAKMIFIVVPLLLAVAGFFRVIFTLGTSFSILYRIHDFVCSILLLLPIFINGTAASLKVGEYSAVALFFFALSEMVYCLWKGTGYGEHAI